MATEFKWKAPTEALTEILGATLNTLPFSTSDITGFSGVSAEIPNASDQYQYIALELILGTQLSARTAGGYVGVYLAQALDGTTVEDTANKAFAVPLALFSLDAAVTARRLQRANIPIPPVDFRLYLLNNTGVNLAAVGNTVKYRRYNEQSITF